MKNILYLFSVFALVSCNKISQDVENSFTILGNKMDSLSMVEFNKIEKSFKEINSKRIKKFEGENSARIYYSIQQYNIVLDSLINELQLNNHNTKQSKNKISNRYFDINESLKSNLKSLYKLNTSIKIDSLINPKEDLGMLPNFAMVAELQKGKFSANETASLIITQLKEQILKKNENK